MARRQLELSNEVAAELAGAQDVILKTLEEHLSADIFLRGNVVTLDGDAEAVQLAATVVFIYLGALDSVVGWVALAITLVSWFGLAASVRGSLTPRWYSE